MQLKQLATCSRFWNNSLTEHRVVTAVCTLQCLVRLSRSSYYRLQASSPQQVPKQSSERNQWKIRGHQLKECILSKLNATEQSIQPTDFLTLNKRPTLARCRAHTLTKVLGRQRQADLGLRISRSTYWVPGKPGWREYLRPCLKTRLN